MTVRPSGETTILSTISSVSTIGFPAGVIRHPFGKSKPPGMACGSWVVASPTFRFCGRCPVDRDLAVFGRILFDPTEMLSLLEISDGCDCGMTSGETDKQRSTRRETKLGHNKLEIDFMRSTEYGIKADSM